MMQPLGVRSAVRQPTRASLTGKATLSEVDVNTTCLSELTSACAYQS